MRRHGTRSGWSISVAPLLLAAWASSWAHPGPARGGDEETRWYSPRIEDFRPEYDRDETNRRVQSWREYSGWINAFYSGNSFSVGWTRQAKASVAPVKSAEKQKELIKLLNNLGKEISREWAKDNGIRKISTNDLNRWNGMIRNAQRADRGTGAQLKSTLESIQTEVAKRLR